jgi:hypothetical protein
VGSLRSSQGPMTFCALRLRKPNVTIRRLTLPVAGSRSTNQQILGHLASGRCLRTTPASRQDILASAWIRGHGPNARSAFHQWVPTSRSG